EIRESESQIVRLSFNRPKGDQVFFSRQFANSFRGDSLAVRIVGRSIALKRFHHCRARGQRLPASAKAACTFRTSRIDHMMSNLSVSSIDSPVQYGVNNNAPVNCASHGNVNQPASITPRTPSSFGKSGGDAVVFERNLHAKNLREIFHRTLAAPCRQKIDIAELSAHGI